MLDIDNKTFIDFTHYEKKEEDYTKPEKDQLKFTHPFILYFLSVTDAHVSKTEKDTEVDLIRQGKYREAIRSYWKAYTGEFTNVLKEEALIKKILKEHFTKIYREENILRSQLQNALNLLDMRNPWQAHYYIQRMLEQNSTDADFASKYQQEEEAANPS